MANHPPFAQLMEMNDGYIVPRALQIAAELGIADVLADGARDVDDLAAATTTDPQALYRWLRVLASHGVFSEIASRRFALTPLAQPMRSDVPDSVRSWITLDSRLTFPVFADALASLRTGQPAHEQVFGAPFFQHLAQEPELAEMFDAAMADHARHVGAALLDVYDFSSCERIVDVGGGTGTLLATLLRGLPDVTGVLFDLPHVADRARDTLTDAGVADRCKIVPGDFFAAVPSGGDVYTLSLVIHDWENQDAIVILRNCRDALPPDGCVVLLEHVIPEGDEPHPGKLLDLVMLVAVGGRERTKREYAELLAAAGLQLQAVTPTRTPVSIIEASR